MVDGCHIRHGSQRQIIRLDVPLKGEAWLHEWLHGVCVHFVQQGHQMPVGDADGADRHGYVCSPTTGWTDYYRGPDERPSVGEWTFAGYPFSLLV